jgi:hypothetical protein
VNRNGPDPPRDIYRTLDKLRQLARNEGATRAERAAALGRREALVVKYDHYLDLGRYRCQVCRTLIDDRRSNGRYCSNACRQKAYRQRRATA